MNLKELDNKSKDYRSKMETESKKGLGQDTCPSLELIRGGNRISTGK